MILPLPLAGRNGGCQRTLVVPIVMQVGLIVRISAWI